MRVVAIGCLCVLLSGCASITNNQLQPVSVTTIMESQQVAGVGCTLTNDEGSWFVTTPGSAMVHKSTAPLAIDCRKASVGVGSQVVESSSNASVWGNLLVGGLIGYVVDRNTGAGFDYPLSVTVALHPYGRPTPASAPNAPETSLQPAQATPSATSTQVQLPKEAPAPSKPKPPPGQFGFEAAKYAREQRCAAFDTSAQFVAKGAGFESYSVACMNGDVMMVRCEFGSCRALR